jgi:hypothetical protein
MNRDQQKAMFASKNKSGLTKEQVGLTENNGKNIQNNLDSNRGNLFGHGDKLIQRQNRLQNKIDKIWENEKKGIALSNELAPLNWGMKTNDEAIQFLDDIAGDHDKWFPEIGEGTWGFGESAPYLSYDEVIEYFKDAGYDNLAETFSDSIDPTFRVNLREFENKKEEIVNDYKTLIYKVKLAEKEVKKAEKANQKLQKKGGKYAQAGLDLLKKEQNSLSNYNILKSEALVRFNSAKALDKKYKLLSR